IAWENVEKVQKFSLILSGNAEFVTRGRNYSEVWELLADSPALVGPLARGGQCNVGAATNFAAANLDNPDDYLEAANGAASSGDCAKFDGITTVDNFARLGLTAAFNFWMGKYARLNIG